MSISSTTKKKQCVVCVLKNFAKDGLRTLVCGYRVLDEDDFAEWLPEREQAERAMVDRMSKLEETAGI